MENKDKFSYTYSAGAQDEIKEIRSKYAPPAEDKLECLRRMDAAVTRKGNAASIALGTVGALLLGLGMSLAMTDIGERLGLSVLRAGAVGIIIGICGIALVCAAYPVYKAIIKRERERIAPEILRLTDELMK